MATWQSTVFLIPRKALAERFGKVPGSISRAQYEAEEWWSSAADTRGLISLVDGLMTRRTTWSDSLTGWGSEDGNRIDMWLKNGAVAELVARIDARDATGFLETLASLSHGFDLVAMHEDGAIREMTADQLRVDLERSRAADFVADPEGHLRRQPQSHDFSVE